MNKLKQNFFIFVVFLATIFLQAHASYNVNLIGFLNDIDSVSRHTSSFIDCVRDKCDRMKLFRTKRCSAKDLKRSHEIVLNESVDLQSSVALRRFIRNRTPLSGVTIYTATQWNNYNRNSWYQYIQLPNKSTIKYAYCVTECTEIPPAFVSRFNNNFDGLIVPDTWLVDVYKKSGVTIPIFTLPLVLDLDSLLSKPIKTEPSKPFIFGFSGVFRSRKNYKLLIDAFTQEFRANPHVKLQIHGRFAINSSKIKRFLETIHNPTIEIIQKGFNRKEYENFISSLDCYVILSKGEGFSITPREALAAGVPCILSNNTAHQTICETGYVAAVDSTIMQPCYSPITKNMLGYEFNCDIQDVKKALRDVYNNYQSYLALAQQGKEWTRQYLIENLKPKYLNVVKPKKVILGDQNCITDNYIMTNSHILFNKYKTLLGNSTNTEFEDRTGL